MSEEDLFEDVDFIPARGRVGLVAWKVVDAFLQSGKRKAKIRLDVLQQKEEVKSASSLCNAIRAYAKKVKKPVNARLIADTVYIERTDTEGSP
jgi:hypothetical protein